MKLDAISQCLKPPILGRSIRVALVIGAVLTAINQGDAIWVGDWPAIWKIALTFLGPFLVASYGAYGAIAKIDPD